jgi:uncharacterized protein YecE (DUF72 family)
MRRRFDQIHIGTSGWTYPHWRGPFYPEDLPDDQRLRFYAEHLTSVEINNSFYHLPEKSTLVRWRDSTPADFVFTAKASRYITHMKKLKDPQASVHRFMERIADLGDKLGPILFQLPPRWRLNIERLARFLEALDSDQRYAFEFRDPSWFDDRVYALLEHHRCAFCIYELAGMPSPKELTADFVYVRLHGPGEAYQGSYDTRTLAGWAGAFSSWRSVGREVYCYFDNDEAGYAAGNALQLARMLE